MAHLSAIGYDVATTHGQAEAPANHVVDLALKLEEARFGASIGQRTDIHPSSTGMPPDLIIDLTGQSNRQDAPVLTVEVAGKPSLEHGLTSLRGGTGLVSAVARLDQRPIAGATPMISDRIWLSRDIENLASATQSLIVSSVKRFHAGKLATAELPNTQTASGAFLPAYLGQLAKGLAGRLLRRIRRDRPFYWQTAYRLLDGPGIAETARVEGTPFTVLPDDGTRFYADPFIFIHENRHYLFVEEFPYSEGRGIISVAELGSDGRFGRPTPVLIEPHHLSYPNVFEWEGQIFMIPEGSAAREVTLYRAELFPHRWVRDTVMLSGIVLNDATLIHHDGLIWMFGTEQFGRGSASDTLVAYYADNIRGPWRPHALNPLIIDQSGARPGGHIVTMDGRHYLPVQDGSRGYGNGLGLREITALGVDDIQFGAVRPITMEGAWQRQGIHTLNRAGRVEVIDSTR